MSTRRLAAVPCIPLLILMLTICSNATTPGVLPAAFAFTGYGIVTDQGGTPLNGVAIASRVYRACVDGVTAYGEPIRTNLKPLFCRGASMRKLSRTAALLLVVAAPVLPAQVTETLADSPAVVIMTRVGSRASAAWLRDILRQARRPQPQAKLDEIADSLVARAIDPASADQRSAAYVRSAEALLALVSAGSDAPWEGRPYAGVFERLVRVHQQGRGRIRGKALAGMLETSHTRAVQYLSEVAESTDSTAHDAIWYLTTDANGGSWTGILPTASEARESAAALKALASRDRVTNAAAAQLLRMWIARNGSEDLPNGRP